MQISRHLLLACAVAMYLTPAALRAYDNESQIRARQALEEKMNQLQTPAAQTNPPATPAPSANDTQAQAQPTPAPQAPALKPVPAVTTDPGTQQKLQDALDQKMNEAAPAQAAPAAPATAATTNSEPAPAPKKKKARAHKPAPAPAAPVQAQAAPENPPAQPPPAAAPEISQPATPTPAVPATTITTDTATQEQLQRALDEKMQQQKSSTTVAAPTAPAAPAAPQYAPLNTPGTPPEQAQQAPAEQTQQQAPAQENNNFAPIAPSEQNPNNTKMQQALQQKMNQAPAATANAPTMSPGKGRNNMAPQPAMNLPTLQGPPTGLSAEKQQKLDAILQQYRADQLTPEQYHEQRAKILEEK